MKPGRNDPCLCGSGRKYKHCCLVTSSEPAVVNLADQTWQRLREATEGYAADILGFIMRAYGPHALNEAFVEFTLDPEAEFAHGDPISGLFFPWFFHHWTPAKEKGSTANPALYGTPPTRAYLEHKGRQINPIRQRYLEACLAAPMSFHEVLRCEPGAGFDARDVFGGTEAYVRDRSASSTLTRGDILFGQVVHVQGIVMLEAAAPYSFPPAYKTHLIQLRHRKELQEHRDLALRGIYFSLAEAYLNPPRPVFHNTDGDRIEPRKLYFDIESAQAAFDALKSAALGTGEEELRSNVRFDVAGNIVEATIPWVRKASAHAAMDTVVVATLRIDGRKLVAEVNSANRAGAVRALIAEKLGAGARYKSTRKQSIESAVPPQAESVTGAGVRVASRDAEQEALMQRPEVREQLAAFQRRHYETWPEIPLPALDGKTPLEAVKDAEGREMVDALITQFERDSQRLPGVGVDAEIFAELRRRLGM